MATEKAPPACHKRPQGERRKGHTEREEQTHGLKKNEEGTQEHRERERRRQNRQQTGIVGGDARAEGASQGGLQHVHVCASRRQHMSKQRTRTLATLAQLPSRSTVPRYRTHHGAVPAARDTRSCTPCHYAALAYTIAYSHCAPVYIYIYIYIYIWLEFGE